MIVANPAEPVTGAVPERGVPEPAVTEAYRMRAGATVDSRADGTLVLRHGRSALLLDRPGAGRRAVLLRLAEGWLDDAEVVRVVTAADPERRILPVQILLRRLAVHSWLERRLRCGGQPLLDIRPRDPG
ncbi:MAG TPA: hypothetical protein VJT31_09325, partial [Rugosimonospora sp.]|nr:hypothetical protein [Rugosimonospora sp.]